MKRLLVGAAVVVGGLLLLGFAVAAVLAKAYRAPSASMEPTLKTGARFLVLRGDREAKVGDVVVLHPPRTALGGGSLCVDEPPEGAMCAAPGRGEAEVSFVKRVVARGGDRIAMRGGRIVRNGRAEPGGPRFCAEEACQFPREVTVPAGHLFVLGDNRGASDDSRFWGPVPETAVTGRYWFSYWRG